ncbi:MAG TPA: pyridoxamine 5'-phosphate oxidase family protein [Candidatus Acidoferrum sp.]|nr:pyridoxamine 5'-phosphate oxidase family protein [Candidatus Acidoferrum sp.]
MTAEKAERQDAAEAVSEKEKEMDVEEVFQFMNRESLAVLATVGDNGQPQATVMGFAVTRELEIVFDTVRLRAKYANSNKNPRVAWVIGCTMEVAVPYEGSARELQGEELAKYQQT